MPDAIKPDDPTNPNPPSTTTTTSKHVALGSLGTIILGALTWLYNNYSLPEKHYPPVTRSAENRDSSKWGQRTPKDRCRDLETFARIMITSEDADAAKNGRENPHFSFDAAACEALQTPKIIPAPP